MTTDPKLMGNIVSFSPPDEVPYATLKAALTAAGWSADAAREMLPRDAFSRAAREMKKGRVIDVVGEDEHAIQFQFTRKWIDAQECHYTKETTLTLDKNSGVVTGTNGFDAELAAQATALVAAHIGKRSRTDILRCIRKTYDGAKADLIVVSDAGGVYFVPDDRGSLLDQTAAFLAAIGGRFRSRFRVFFGDPKDEHSAASNVFEHLQGLIAEWRETVADITPDSKSFMVDRRRAAQRDIRAKLEAYRGLLSTYAEKVDAELADADAELLARLRGTFNVDDETSPDDHRPNGTPEQPQEDPDAANLAALAALMTTDDDDDAGPLFAASRNYATAAA